MQGVIFVRFSSEKRSLPSNFRVAMLLGYTTRMIHAAFEIVPIGGDFGVPHVMKKLAGAAEPAGCHGLFIKERQAPNWEVTTGGPWRMRFAEASV